VALLTGLGLYRVYRRRQSGQVDSSFMESRLQPDSFFGASGGQKIDTDEAALSGSSMMYSPSQLDAGADVDPVAEADVYLAYGRDLQAEEILKEALRTNPSRAAIHFKLLQIYAKRPDVKGYAVTAADAYKLTSGLGAEWMQACEVGREIDPTNPLYHGDEASRFVDIAQSDAMSLRGNDQSFASTDISSVPTEPQSVNSGFGLDLDLDLDLDFSDSAPTGANASALVASPLLPDFSMPQTMAMAPHSMSASLPTSPALPSLDLDFDSSAVESVSYPAAVTTIAFKATGTSHQATTLAMDSNAMQFIPGDFDVDPSTAKIHEAPTPAKGDMLEFDLNSLSLDLDDHQPSAQPSSHGASHQPLHESSHDDALMSNDPLATKMALAEEFQTIGDDDGARALAQEVADGASGNLKAKAKRFLTELG
jgi:pilus assembly protein FimV